MYRNEEELRRETAFARSYPILLTAESLGYTVKRAGNSYYAEGMRQLVFFPRTNSFYDYYERQGGSVIDFVMHEKGLTVGAAIEYINMMSGANYEQDRISGGVQPQRSVRQGNKEKFILPERNTDHRRVFAYLTKTRHISPDVVKYCLHNSLIYEAAVNHNAVFVAYDKKGTARHAFLRGTGTYSDFRGDVAGSDKAYGFSVCEDSDRLVIFEAPIDMLSYMSLKPDVRTDMLAIGMLADFPVYRYLKDNPKVKKISVLTDTDIYGTEFKNKLQTELIRKGYVITPDDIELKMTDAGVKDVNEYLAVTAAGKMEKPNQSRGRAL